MSIGKGLLVATVGLLSVGVVSPKPAQAQTTELIRAAQQGDKGAVQALLRRSVDVNATEGDGMTALHWAARRGDLDMVTTLLRSRANPNAQTRTSVTPLGLAAENGSVSIIAALTKAGADPNLSQIHGVSPLMLAARAGSADSIAELLARGAKVDASESAAGENALMWAAARNNQAAVVALVKGRAALDARSKVLALTPFRWETDGMLSSMLPRGGWTPLAYAAREGSMEAARALVEAGAALNIQDPDGTTPLVKAIENGHFDLAVMLLNSGADPNIADSTGMAALFAAVDIHTLGPIDYRSPPVLDDNTTAIDLINALIAHKADVNARLSRPVLGRHIDRGDRLMGAGSTPLMRAAKTNDIPVMKLLVEKGADPFALQDDLTSVLMIAANGGARPGTYGGPYPVTEDGALEAVKLCLEWGLDVNAFNTKGQTALHSAVSRRAKRLIQLLVDNGARLDMITKEGRTVLSLARPIRRARDATPAAEGPNEIDELLRKLMADKGITAVPEDNASVASGLAKP